MVAQLCGGHGPTLLIVETRATAETLTSAAVVAAHSGPRASGSVRCGPGDRAPSLESHDPGVRFSEPLAPRPGGSAGGACLQPEGQLEGRGGRRPRRVQGLRWLPAGRPAALWGGRAASGVSWPWAAAVPRPSTATGPA